MNISMNDFWLYLIFASGVAFGAGYLYSHWRLYTEFDRMLSTIKNSQVATASNIPATVELEHYMINGINYFYTSAGQFMGQGETLDAAAEHYRYMAGKNTIAFFTHAVDGTTHCFVAGTCKRCVFEEI